MASAHVTDVTDATFDTEVLQSDLPVLVDFWAAWCGPCKAIAPHLEKLAEEKTGQLKVVKLDAQAHMAVASKYGVTGLPTFLVFKGGQEVGRKIGAGGGGPGLATFVQPHLG